MFLPFLGNIKAFLSINIPIHSLSHPVMLSFAFFWRRLGHLEIMWVIVSSLALHICHFGSFLVPSILVLILLVLMYCSWALVIRDSLSLFEWPFHNQYQDFMSAISSVSLMNLPWSLFLQIFFFFLVFHLCLVIFGGSVTSCSLDDLHARAMSLPWLFWT